MSQKRRRELPAVDTQLVEIFDDLANEDEEIRLKAAQSLLKKASPDAGLASEKLNEILRRLIRGLCSGRKAARLGFSVALTEYLIQLLGPDSSYPSPPTTLHEVIRVLEEQTRIGSNVGGQEERDHYFGRLFGAETLIKSGVLFHRSVDNHYWSEVLDLLFGLAKKKVWLQEECGWILYNAIHSLNKNSHPSNHVQLIVNKLQDNDLTTTPEGVAIWIGTMLNFPKVKLSRGVWHKENPLHQKEKAKLAKILKGASSASPDQGGDVSKFSGQGAWTPKLHFAWEVILARVLDTHCARSSKELGLADLWNECVDENLFSASSSEERKYWGFLIFQRALRDAPAQYFPIIFSKNLMRCLINQLASPNRYLHRIAEKSVKAIILKVDLDSSLAVPVLECLLSPPNGQANFDHATKTKMVEKLISSLDDKRVKDLVAVSRKMLLRPGTQEPQAAGVVRQVVADQLVNLVRSRQFTDGNFSSDASEGIQMSLSILADFAYFNSRSGKDVHTGHEPSEDPPFSTASRDLFKSRILSCLTHLISKSHNPAKFAYDMVARIHTREDQEDFPDSFLSEEETVRESMRKAWKVLEKIHHKASSDSAKGPLLSAFMLLYSLTILQVYNFEADAVTMLDELKLCYETLIKHRSKGSHGGSDALVEIILSLVSKRSVLFRRLGEQVFSAFASYIGESGLQSMKQVLMTKENIVGQEEMFDVNDDDDRDDEMSDVEEVDKKDVEAAKDDSSQDKDSDGEASSSGESVDEELAEFDAKLAQALGVRTMGDSDFNEQSSDEDMNDEQMEALDSHLETVFRERKKVVLEKTQKKEAKETIVNFKCRVLELLDIFVKHRHTSYLALTLLPSLLSAIQTTKSPLVSSKALDLIRKYSQLCKKEKIPSSTVEAHKDAILSLLKGIHEQATKEGSNAYASACSQASLLFVKVLASQDRESLKQILRIYAKTQEQALFDPKCRVKTSFFSDWLNWCASARPKDTKR